MAVMTGRGGHAARVVQNDIGRHALFSGLRKMTADMLAYAPFRMECPSPKRPNMNAKAAWPTSAMDPEHAIITEAVRGSSFPVHLTYVEMVDGAYIPIGLRKPEGEGPFPIVLFATGNGGGGMAMLRDHVQNKSWTHEQFLAAGYATAWMRYRAEVDY